MSTSPAASFLFSRRIASGKRREAFARLWLRRWRDRRALCALHPEQMREVGLGAHDVRTEAEKPFWRA